MVAHNARNPLSQLGKDSTVCDNNMQWIARYLCFYGFLWAGKAVPVVEEEYDPLQHLLYGDVVVDSLKHPSYLSVNINQNWIRSEKSMGHYRSHWWPTMPSGSSASIHGAEKTRRWSTLQVQVWPSLDKGMHGLWTELGRLQIGIYCPKYSNHSFQVGAAMTVAAQGIQDLLIKMMGCMVGECGLSIVCKDSHRTTIVSLHIVSLALHASYLYMPTYLS